MGPAELTDPVNLTGRLTLFVFFASWLYRILPPVVHEKYKEVEHPFVKADFAKEKLTPQQMRWKPMPLPAEAEKLDFVDGLRTIGKEFVVIDFVCDVKVVQSD